MGALLLPAVLSVALAEGPGVTVHPDRVVHRVSRLLTGACLEDVNHEVYGGIYSQMLYGESFQEPAPQAAIAGFRAYGGEWRVEAGEVRASGPDGPKLVSDAAPFRDGEVSVEMLLPEGGPGKAGLILRVSGAGGGVDEFDGYEVSLDAQAQAVTLGRHRHDWRHFGDVPCPVPAGRWISVRVRLEGSAFDVWVDGRHVARHDDGPDALPAGSVALRPWQRVAHYRNLKVTVAGREQALPLAQPAPVDAVSRMWRPVLRGTALGGFEIVRREPMLGAQSQRIRFESGEGVVGIENRGLNRWGLHLQAGKPYEGVLLARVTSPTDLWVALEGGSGGIPTAETRIRVTPGKPRTTFRLTPARTLDGARLTLELRAPGEVTLGYAALHPGAWGRLPGLPVRRDVADGLKRQGITVLRYGGSMINHPEYRWKKMIGPRELRPPCAGTWYPWSSNGWGIIDFMALCRAQGFVCIPAFNMGETPQDMADFIEYANGPADSPWGRKRVANGYGRPFGLKYLELGNEERVDAAYASTFARLAEAIWAKDRDIILVVGDFAYGDPITDPARITGAASGIRDMEGHRAILDLAKRHNREVWFDVHIGTDGPGDSRDLAALPSYIAALGRLADGARHRVAVFEFNSGNHRQRRALSNAAAIAVCERLDLPAVTSANCLQPDGQNDNAWDQGLLFLNLRSVWLQPPGWVTQMVSQATQPLLVEAEVTAVGLEATALRSEDGKRTTIRVLNRTGEAITCDVRVQGLRGRGRAMVRTLAAPLEAANSASDPNAVAPVTTEEAMRDGAVRRTFPPTSFTVMQVR
jgi:hypothetical protein